MSTQSAGLPASHSSLSPPSPLMCLQGVSRACKYWRGAEVEKEVLCQRFVDRACKYWESVAEGGRMPGAAAPAGGPHSARL